MWRYGIHVPTEQGYFKVELDYDQKALLIFIEESAISHWLSSILEAFGTNREEGIPWEISQDGEIPINHSIRRSGVRAFILAAKFKQRTKLLHLPKNLRICKM